MRAVLAVSVALVLVGCKSKEEQLKSAEDKAKFLAETKSRMVKGVGEALKTEGKSAAESVSEGAGEVFKGLEKGFDSSMKAVEVKVSDALMEKGLKATRAARGSEAAKKRIVAVYVITEKPFEGDVVLRAYDAKDQEVGRASHKLVNKTPTAQYVEFAFEEHAPIDMAAKFDLR